MLTLPETDRRTLFRHALWLVGASAVPAGADAMAAPAEQPGLDAGQFALLSAVADTIIPKTDTVGAVDVGVPKLLDGLIRKWASAERRTKLLASLDKIGALTPAGGGATFVKLPFAQRTELLTAHDKAALKPVSAEAAAAGPLKSESAVVDPQYGRPKQGPAASQPPGTPVSESTSQKKKPTGLNALMAEPEVVDKGYAKLKELVVVLYYYSQPALTQELRYEHAPGQWVPSIPLTPETRPWGGAGFI